MDQNQNLQTNAERSSFGAMIGVVVIVILLIAGAFYVWGDKLSSGSRGGDIDSIETDLANTELDLDLSELDLIE